MPNIKFDDRQLSRFIPFGLTGQAKPRTYRQILGVLWENKNELPYAWKILNHGVCDGCSLGPYGLRDNAMGGVHVCMAGLKLLKLNTMGALDPTALGNLRRLKQLNPEKLRSLGRLTHPMLRHRDDKGFSRISWNEAFEIITKAVRGAAPGEMSFFAASRGLTNEVYYVFQKLARTLGTNNLDLCLRSEDRLAVTGIRSTLGLGAPTCSLADFIGTDLLVLLGTDLANNQPVAAKYVHYAKKAGTRIIVVNSVREKRPEHSWAASIAASGLFGTVLDEEFFQVAVGGEIAFINGVIKALSAANRVDHEFIDRRTTGWPQLRAALQQQAWPQLEQGSGTTRAEMERFAALYGHAKAAVFVYDKGLTHDELGVRNVQAVVNLALARGMLGRDKCGIMPIRSHSGVQGAEECGAEPDIFPGGFDVNEENARRFTNLWRHPVPAARGLKLTQMIEAAQRGTIKFLYSIGGNLLETFPDEGFVAAAIAKVPLRVHQGIVLNHSMLVDACETVLLLPGQTRYEQRGGGTSTNIERRIRFSPEIPRHEIGEALPEWEIPARIGRRAMSNGHVLFPYTDSQSIRDEMARVMPMYQGIEKLNKEGDQLQWGGPSLYKNGFSQKPGHRAVFTVLEPPEKKESEEKFFLTTRPSRESRPMSFGVASQLLGTNRRDVVLISPEDARRLRLEDGSAVVIKSAAGEMKAVIQVAQVKSGTLQAFWPEGHRLLLPLAQALPGEPTGEARVWIEKAPA